MTAADFFTLPFSLRIFSAHFPADAAPWVWLPCINNALADITSGERHVPPGVHIEGTVWIDPSVQLPAYATIIGPAWIGPHTEIRPGAFIRGHVIVGAGCVLGNACEFKNCLIMDNVQVPHFSYVGDSILGNGTHLGAGVICSNLRLDQQPVTVRVEGNVIETGLRKFGAIVGDGAEVGCNAVLNPGTLLGKRTRVMPTVAFAGHLPANTIACIRSTITQIPRKD